MIRHWNGQTEEHPTIPRALLSTFSTGFRNALDASMGVFVPFPDFPIDAHGATNPNDRGWLYDSLAYQAFAPQFADGRSSYVNNNRFDWKAYNANLEIGKKGTKPLLIDSLDFEYTKQPVLAAHVEGVLQPDGRTVIYKDAYGLGVHRKIFFGNQRFSDAISCPSNPGVDLDIWFDINTRGKDARGFDWYGRDASDGQHKRWDRTNPLTLVGPFELRLLNGVDPLDLAGKTTYIRPDIVQLASGNQWPVPMLLTADGAAKRRLRKVVPLTILNQAVYPLEIGTVSSFFSGAGDGSVERNNEVIWSDARNTSFGTFTNATGTPVSAMASFSSVDSLYSVRRVFLPFDTSSLPDNATISAATLRLYVTATNGLAATDIRFPGPTTQASPSSLVSGDFDKCGAVNSPSTYRSAVLISNLTLSSYNNFAIVNANSFVSLTGFTLPGLRMDYDVDNLTPSESHSIQLSLSETAGTSQDPILEVTYTAIITASLAASLIPSGIIVKRASKTLTSAFIPSGVMTKASLIILKGTISFLGTLIQLLKRLLAGAVTSSTSVTASKVLHLSLSGILSLSGAILKRAVQMLSGTLSSFGTLARFLFRQMAAALTLSGKPGIQVFRPLNSQIQPVGALRPAALKLLGGMLSSFGIMTKGMIRTLSAILSLSGLLSRAISRLLGAALTMSGVAGVLFKITLAGVLISVGTLMKMVRMAFSAILSFAGVLKISGRPGTATMSFESSSAIGTLESPSVAGTFESSSATMTFEPGDK